VKQAMAGRNNMVAKFNGHTDFVLSVTFNRDGDPLCVATPFSLVRHHTRLSCAPQEVC
jgi:hypothetical protein